MTYGLMSLSFLAGRTRMPNIDCTFLDNRSSFCVVSNALLLKAALPEADILVDSALCAGVTPEKHAAALETLRSCQVEVK